MVSKCFFCCSPLQKGKDSHFDEYIFQMGWFNHQLAKKSWDLGTDSFMGIWGGKKAQAPTLFASKNHSSFLRNMTSIRRRLFPFQMKWAKDDGVIDRFFEGAYLGVIFQVMLSLRIGVFMGWFFLTIRSPTIWDRVPLFSTEKSWAIEKTHIEISGMGSVIFAVITC